MQLKFLETWRKKSRAISTILLEIGELWQIFDQLLSVLIAPTGDCFSLKIYQKNWAGVNGGGLKCISKGNCVSIVWVFSQKILL